MIYTSSSSLTVKPGNKLYRTSQQQSDSNCWVKRLKLHDTIFTQNHIKHLRQGQEANSAVWKTGMSKGSFSDLLEALGALKSGFPKGDPHQYQVENALGFIGKYQFGEPLMINLSYYKAAVYYGHGANKNYWQCTWTGKKGIDSKTKFLNSPDVQELAIREAFALNWICVNDSLNKQGKSLDDYLGQKKLFDDSGVSKTVIITLSGILAGAYLRGPYSVADLLLKNKVSHDAFGTSILRYMDEYGGYDCKSADFISPGEC